MSVDGASFSFYEQGGRVSMSALCIRVCIVLLSGAAQSQWDETLQVND